jgi:hypothetical protein
MSMSPGEALRTPLFSFLRQSIRYNLPLALDEDDVLTTAHQLSDLYWVLTPLQNSMIMLRGPQWVGATNVEGSIGSYLVC